MSGRFTSEQLKKIAMGTMFLDHAAAAIIYSQGLKQMSPLLDYIGIAMRLVGRMAFPLYTFLLVQGFMWTRDWRKYVMRMAAFALISEVPFDLMIAGEVWYPQAQNTIVTLLCGLICMKMLEMLEQRFGLMLGMEQREYRKERAMKASGNEISSKWIGISLGLWAMEASMVAAEILRGDYGGLGVLLICVFYVFRHRPVEQVVAGCLALVLIYNLGSTVLFAWIAFFFISRYNGERGRKLGYLPYVFYPAHLLVVWLAGVVIAGI